MAPSRLAFMTGSTACIPQNGPSSPMESPHCSCSSVVSPPCGRGVPPPQALFTRTSTVPQVSRATATMATTSSLRLASVWTKRTSAPNSSRQAPATACAGVVVDLGHAGRGRPRGRTGARCPARCRHRRP